MNLDSGSSANAPSSISVPPSRNRGTIAAQNVGNSPSFATDPRIILAFFATYALDLSLAEKGLTIHRKDKTMVEILDSVNEIKGWVRQQPDYSRSISMSQGFGPPQPSPSSQPSLGADMEDNPFGSSATLPNEASSHAGQPYRHATAGHKILMWPAIRQLVLQAGVASVGGLNHIEQNGTVFLTRIQESSPVLTLDDSLQSKMHVGMQSQASRASGGSRTTFPALTREAMLSLATSYFDTFNFMYPFMDRQNFLSDTLGRVCTEGFDGDSDSVIALLVFALGELAHEGTTGPPVDYYKGRPSGVRGGTSLRPPGLALFNEARKRIGFVISDFDLEHVQIFSLTALYYQCCSRYTDFWRLSVAASSACHALITCRFIDWASPRGDLIKRAYWHCAITETCLNMELDIPYTGIIHLESLVGIPSFNAPFCDQDHQGNLVSHFEAHYASQVALRRTCVELHNAINDSTPNSTNASQGSGPNAHSLKQLASKLSEFRNMLQPPLRWSDDNPTAFPTSQPEFELDPTSGTPMVSQYQSGSNMPPQQALFTFDLDRQPNFWPYAYDIQVALLRTRFYYAKYLAHRPFVFKALHYPDSMTSDDAEGAAECLRSCLNWPLLASPVSRRKRLVPYLFCWSQNFLGILLIIHLTQYNTMLKNIRAEFCGQRFEEEIGKTVELMLDWIRDLKSTDRIAEWCWKVLRGIYHDEP